MIISCSITYLWLTEGQSSSNTSSGFLFASSYTFDTSHILETAVHVNEIVMFHPPNILYVDIPPFPYNYQDIFIQLPHFLDAS